jgi:hypothetical protein
MAKRRNIINQLPLAPVFALLFGTAVAIVIGAAPQWRFEQAIEATGLASVLSVARPPLGLKARLLAVALGFALVAILVWLAVTAVQRLIEGPATLADDDVDDALDLAMFASALPPIDAPRRPISADRELGAPFMSDEALTRIVAPTSPRPQPEVIELPAISAEEIVAVDVIERDSSTGDIGDPLRDDADLGTPLQLAEFDVAPAPDEPEQLPGESSIEALIRRLEAGLARRAGPPPTPPGAAANPLNVMRDLMAINREREAEEDDGSARALDTLQQMVARRLAS